MSVTDFKRKSKKAYFLMGTVCVLIPALIAMVTMSMMFYNCSAENKVLKTELRMKDKSKGYVLTQDVAAGTEIKAEMLKEVSLTGKKETKVQSVDKKMLIGKYAKSAFSKGTFMNAQCVYEEEEYSSDMRIYEFDFIDVSVNMQTGEFVDIRIAYPNGEDYIIVNHKQIVHMNVVNPEQVESNYRIHMKVSEEEILRLASAYVDMSFYPGSRIYAVSYLDQFQQAGVVNYPVNSQVFQLLGWNPNLLEYVSSEEELQHRAVLEKNLLEYADDNKESISTGIKQEDSTIDTATFFE